MLRLIILRKRHCAIHALPDFRADKACRKSFNITAPARGAAIICHVNILILRASAVKRLSVFFPDIIHIYNVICPDFRFRLVRDKRFCIRNHLVGIAVYVLIGKLIIRFIQGNFKPFIVSERHIVLRIILNRGAFCRIRRLCPCFLKFFCVRLSLIFRICAACRECKPHAEH